ncbi:MAG TPA: DUF1844 domain-containing protein [Candidatus Krumholzibacteria bacterium]|nr:DUF1844 domain-containing protein [Candidatus Krumholzibacteria bacterium]
MSNPSRDEILFHQLVAMFQYAAMQQMGKLPSHVSGKIERDLEQARVSIDMLEMLHKRTQSHRSADESEFLDKVLFELRMNFVDESGRTPAPEDGKAAGPDTVHDGEGTEGS